MDTNWDHWVHLMCSTRGHWLPGDPRGFRNHDHRIHSSGDYKTPPPEGEHAGLYRYARDRSRKTVKLVPHQRAIAGDAIVAKLDAMDLPVRALAVGAAHVHALVRIGDADAVELFGMAKQAASHKLRNELPGTIWGERSGPKRIKNQWHYRRVVKYILDHAKEGAWVWEHPTIPGRRVGFIRGFEDSAPASQPTDCQSDSAAS